MAGCIVIIGIIWKYSSRVYIRHLRIAAAVIAIFSAAGIITMALNAEYVPMADQEYVYIVLKNLFTGNYTELQEYWYYNVYPYQLGVGAIYFRQLQYYNFAVFSSDLWWNNNFCGE